MANKFSVQQEIDILELEKSKISREKAGMVLSKGLTLYVAFLLVGIIGFANEYIDAFMLNVLVIAGIVVLFISTLPYVIIVHNEERWINKRLQELKK